jgi:Calcineurin-like phosphoesterase
MNHLFLKKPLGLALASCLVLAVPGMASAADLSTGSKQQALNSVTSLASEAPTSTNSLQSNKQLGLDQYITSTNGTYRFYLQGDGNLVVRNMQTSSAVWSASTQNKGGVRLTMQSDGNLALYTSTNVVVWSSNTIGKGASYLIMQNDGNLVLATSAGATVWASNTGTTPPSTGGTKIAFVGDTAAGGSFQSVLNLIKAEGAKLTVVLGDTSYSSSSDNTWDSMVRNTLGSTDPALFVVGNHDIDDSNYSTVRNLAQARLDRQTAVKCSSSYPTSTGTSGAMACQLNNVYMVLSGVGTTGSRSSNESALASKLNSAPSGAWRICAWHKNQKEMQVGGKIDEVGWTAYETCRQKGAIIATGHEHSYSRTHLLSSMTNRTVVDSSSPYTLTNGRTLAFVSGLGGTTPRDQERSGSWWGKIYTATQGAKHGVLFGTFYASHADFYFKNVSGQIIDSFTVQKGY